MKQITRGSIAASLKKLGVRQAAKTNKELTLKELVAGFDACIPCCHKIRKLVDKKVLTIKDSLIIVDAYVSISNAMQVELKKRLTIKSKNYYSSFIIVSNSKDIENEIVRLETKADRAEHKADRLR